MTVKTVRATFDCIDCGRTLPATDGECDKCGAHYKSVAPGEFVQTAPGQDWVTE